MKSPHPILHRTILPLLIRRLRIDGLEHLPQSGPFLLVGNHQSYLDAIQLTAVVVYYRHRKPWFLTKDQVGKFFAQLGSSWLLRWLGMIPIDRRSKSEALIPAIEHLQRGGIIGIFPEGTRNKPSLNPDWRTVLMKAKTGAARMVLATGVPVIPVGIEAPAGLTIRDAIKSFFSPRASGSVTFGPPLHFETARATDVTKELLDDVSRRMMKEVGQLCHKTYPY